MCVRAFACVDVKTVVGVGLGVIRYVYLMFITHICDLQLLLEFGADPEIKNAKGVSSFVSIRKQLLFLFKTSRHAYTSVVVRFQSVTGYILLSYH